MIVIYLSVSLRKAQYILSEKANKYLQSKYLHIMIKYIQQTYTCKQHKLAAYCLFSWFM